MFSWKDIDSSVMQKVGHSDEGNILRIVFNSGSIYDYENVPLDVYRSMIRANSVGRYYHNYIKGAYKSSQIFDMNCFPFSEKDARDFLEDDDFLNDLCKDKEEV